MFWSLSSRSASNLRPGRSDSVMAALGPSQSCADHIVYLPASDKVCVESPDTKVALVELYTSEGCSSCPSAEAWVGALRDDPGVLKQLVPEAFHVDYWNHLG